jgi:hypothetical protein
MEVLVWLVFGTNGWKQLNSERPGSAEAGDPDSLHTDGFFDLNEDDDPRVRETVVNWMEEVRKNARLKNTQRSLAGLLNLGQRGA